MKNDCLMKIKDIFELKKKTKYVSIQFNMKLQSIFNSGDPELFGIYRCIIVESVSMTDADYPLIKKVFPLTDEIKVPGDVEPLKRHFQGTKSNAAKSLVRRDSNDEVLRRILTYPPTGLGAISISVEDYMCLECGEFLNDVIINFFLKYFFQEILTEEQREKTFIFDTFFYEVLMAKSSRQSIPTLGKTVAQKRYERVEKCTQYDNIFEKDFVIVPINRSLHWFLAIICFPGLIRTDVDAQKIISHGQSNGANIEDNIFDDESEAQVIKR